MLSIKAYADYQKELYGRETIYDDSGFLVYDKKEDGSVFIQSIYVIPRLRLHKAASKLLDKLIKKENPTMFSSYVDLTTNNFNEAIKAHIAYGFKVHSAQPTAIVFIKELNK